jgi:hypothetical protein
MCNCVLLCAAACCVLRAACCVLLLLLLLLLRLLRLQVAAFATGGVHGSFPVSILFMSETLGMSPSGVGGTYHSRVL